MSEFNAYYLDSYNSFQLDSNNYFNLNYSAENHLMEEEKSDNKANSLSTQLQTQTSTNDSNQLQIIDSGIYNRKQVNFSIQPIINPNSKQLNLFTGLSITDDGVIRFHSSLNQVCFGIQQQQVVQVEDLNKLGVVNIQLSRSNGYIEHSIQQALDYLQYVPNMPYDLASKYLSQVNKSISLLRQALSSSQIEYQDEQKNEEVKKFVDLFFKFLEKYNELNPHQMYHYSIGRINTKIQDMEFIQNGYSKAYLDFLGMNAQTLSQIVLRNQKVDLIRNKLDITNQALKGIQNLYEHHGEDQIYESYITTFDGFPIKVIQKKRDYANIFGLSKLFGEEYEYEFIITEIDVELDDLQHLIEYRQRISSDQNNIGYDDFLNRELSFLFEDVEYSIQSHEFIERFYQNNINALKLIEQFKKKISPKVCGYRSINQ